MDINDDYYLIVKDILNSDEFIKRKNYRHHGDISVYEHSLKVSRLSYEIAKKINLSLKRQVFNEYDMAIGALLHDFYYNHIQKIILKSLSLSNTVLFMQEKHEIILENFFHST